MRSDQVTGTLGEATDNAVRRPGGTHPDGTGHRGPCTSRGGFGDPGSACRAGGALPPGWPRSSGLDIDTLLIHGGRYYVDGILCDADRPAPGIPVPDEDDKEQPAPGTDAHWDYWNQPDGFRDPENPVDRLPSPAQSPFVVYLKVWERAVSAAGDPALREVALGAALPDTAVRAKVVWQVLPLSLIRARHRGRRTVRPGRA